MSIQLRPDQERVAEYRGGYLAVPAVPGAGKTTVLAHLGAELIAAGLPRPGRILIVTYTNSAVGNFRSRIGDFLEERGLPRGQGYEVRTIHSLALHIVREQPASIGWSDAFTMMSEPWLQGLLERLTRKWIGRNRDLWESRIRTDLKGRRRDDALARWEQLTQSRFS
jgi:DNA helicase-2/ATP-dependent DNA helicase PcrA